MSSLSIDCEFPGGNIIVERVRGDDVFVRQDLRDTDRHWFYWSFRVRGAGGRTLRFHFTDGKVVGVRGPAASFDGGASWSWLGGPGEPTDGFAHSFGAGPGEARFAFAVPYLEADLRGFLARHEGDENLRLETHCLSRKGRRVERLRIGPADGEAPHRVLLSCRHHACESAASFTLEGIVEEVLSPGPDGEWLRRRCEFAVLPFMDKDGVEDGDQGKGRSPHDHNRDYAGESIYPETRAVREFAPRWSEGRLAVALDIHCPHMAGEYNEWIYFVGSPDEENWRRVVRFSELLESDLRGPLPYSAGNNLPFGEAWNTPDNFGGGTAFGTWACGLPGVRVAAGMEIPYANAEGVPVTPEGARAFGRDLARAIRRYLENDLG